MQSQLIVVDYDIEQVAPCDRSQVTVFPSAGGLGMAVTLALGFRGVSMLAHAPFCAGDTEEAPCEKSTKALLR